MEREAENSAQSSKAVRRAGNLAALAVVAFGAFYWVSTQVAQIRAASPWAEDPPDAFVSIGAMLVAFVAVLTFVRVQRWNPEPIIPAAARRDILHGIAVALVAIWAATGAATFALLTGTRAAAWDASIGPLIGLLGASLATAIPATIAVLRAWPAARAGERRDDFLADASAFLRLVAARAPGPTAVVRRPLGALAAWIERLAGARLGPRRAPWLTVAGVALLAAGGIVVAKFVTEGPPEPALMLRAVLVLGGIMAAIVVGGYLLLGRYLNLIGPPAQRG